MQLDFQSVDKTPSWVDTSRFESMNSVLWFIFLQTASSMRSSQFELKRMGFMVGTRPGLFRVVLFRAR